MDGSVQATQDQRGKIHGGTQRCHERQQFFKEEENLMQLAILVLTLLLLALLLGCALCLCVKSSGCPKPGSGETTTATCSGPTKMNVQTRKPLGVCKPSVFVPNKCVLISTAIPNACMHVDDLIFIGTDDFLLSFRSRGNDPIPNDPHFAKTTHFDTNGCFATNE